MEFERLNVEAYKNNAECPLCEGSGWVYKTLLMPLNKEVFICDECNALWLLPKEIEKGFFQDFSEYVESFGYNEDKVMQKNKDYGWYERNYMDKK